MAASEHTLSRRQALAGLSVLGAVAIPSGALASKSAMAQPSSAAWDAAFAHMEACKAKSDASEREWNLLYDAYEAGIPSSDHINWREFGPSADKRHILHGTFDIDGHEKWRLESEGRLWWAGNPEKVRAEIKATCDEVREFRRQLQAHNDRLDYDAATDRLEELVDAYSDSLTALVEMPAPDVSALLWKVNYLFSPESCIWASEYTAQFHRDAGRLLSQGRA